MPFSSRWRCDIRPRTLSCLSLYFLNYQSALGGGILHNLALRYQSGLLLAAPIQHNRYRVYRLGGVVDNLIFSFLSALFFSAGGVALAAFEEGERSWRWAHVFLSAEHSVQLDGPLAAPCVRLFDWVSSWGWFIAGREGGT